MSAGTGTVWYPPEGMLGFSKEAYEKFKTKRNVALPAELPGGGRPNSRFRYAFKKGMTGWEVWALQVALNSHQKTFPIVEDGIFGPQTEECVRREQKNHHIKVDGIIGPETQRRICMVESVNAEERTRVPGGLLYGLIEGESGFYFACVSGPNWNGSYDAGIIQENLGPSELGSVSNWRRGFNLRWGVDDTGTKLRRQYEAYIGDPGAKTHKDAWHCAITYHNWPAAADKMAAGQFDSWRYYAIGADGEGHYYGVDDTAYWVIQASGGRLTTARQWRDEYIRTKALYVTNWNV